MCLHALVREGESEESEGVWARNTRCCEPSAARRVLELLLFVAEACLLEISETFAFTLHDRMGPVQRTLARNGRCYREADIVFVH